MATYKIKSGDTISQLAQTYGVKTSDLLNLNPQIKNANLIKEGDSLNIPNTTSSVPVATQQYSSPIGPQFPPVSPILNTNNVPPSSYVGYTPPAPTASGAASNYIMNANTNLAQSQSNLASQQQQAQSIATQQQAAQKALDEAISARQSELENKQAWEKNNQTSILDQVKSLTEPFRKTYEDTQREALSVNENFKQNQTLVNELQTLLQEGNDLIAQQKGVTGLSSIRNPRINQTIDAVNARAGVLQAVMAARNSQISVATNLIDRGLNALSADKQDQLSYYNTILELGNNRLLNLDKQSQEVANAKITQLENQLKTSQLSAEYIKKLMTTPDSATYIANAGVTLNDSVDTINSKLATYGNQEEINKTANKLITEGYKQTPIKIANSMEVNVGGKTLYFTPPISKLNDFNDVKSTTGTTSSGSPLSIAEIKSFGETNGWIPPLGSTKSEINTFLQATADLSSDERLALIENYPGQSLSAIISKIQASGSQPQTAPKTSAVSNIWNSIKKFFTK
jgi:hypothetical protein